MVRAVEEAEAEKARQGSDEAEEGEVLFSAVLGWGFGVSFVALRSNIVCNFKFKRRIVTDTQTFQYHLNWHSHEMSQVPEDGPATDDMPEESVESTVEFEEHCLEWPNNVA